MAHRAILPALLVVFFQMGCEEYRAAEYTSSSASGSTDPVIADPSGDPTSIADPLQNTPTPLHVQYLERQPESVSLNLFSPATFNVKIKAPYTGAIQWEFRPRRLSSFGPLGGQTAEELRFSVNVLNVGHYRARVKIDGGPEFVSVYAELDVPILRGLSLSCSRDQLRVRPPLAGNQLQDWNVSYFFNHGTNGEIRNFAGGTVTRSTARSTGFYVYRLNGQPVLSGIEGVVESVFLPSVGVQDTTANCGVGSSANRIVIRHDSGHQITYTGIERNSSTLRVGDKVTAGQVLGTIGHSCNQIGQYLPTVDVMLRACAGDAIDPSSLGLWTSTPAPTFPTRLLMAGTLASDAQNYHKLYQVAAGYRPQESSAQVPRLGVASADFFALVESSSPVTNGLAVTTTHYFPPQGYPTPAPIGGESTSNLNLTMGNIVGPGEGLMMFRSTLSGRWPNPSYYVEGNTQTWVSFTKSHGYRYSLNGVVQFSPVFNFLYAF